MRRVILIFCVGILMTLRLRDVYGKDHRGAGLETYQSTLSSDEVLDIAVAVLDPGIDDVDIGDGVFPEIRRAESTFIARELSQVLDNQGVGCQPRVPSSDYIADVLVSGTILNRMENRYHSLSRHAMHRDVCGLIKLMRAVPVAMRISRPNG